jgi:hypothetical protein
MTSDELPPAKPAVPSNRVDPDDIRKALEQQAKNRPPRPPVSDLPPPIPRLRVDKPHKRKRRKA